MKLLCYDSPLQHQLSVHYHLLCQHVIRTHSTTKSWKWILHTDCIWAGIAQSVQWLTTGWTVRDNIPVGGEIFHTRPVCPWGPPSLLYNGYRVFPRLKQPGCGVDHPPPFSTEVKERVELYLYSPFRTSWSVLGWTLPLPLPFTLTAYDSQNKLLLKICITLHQ
jgi:hypothetical protein